MGSGQTFNCMGPSTAAQALTLTLRRWLSGARPNVRRVLARVLAKFWSSTRELPSVRRGCVRIAMYRLLLFQLACMLLCLSSARRTAPPPWLSSARRWHAAPSRLRLGAHPAASAEQLSSCTQSWFETDVEHFSWVRAVAAPHCSCVSMSLSSCARTQARDGPGTFSLRYFLCDAHWRATPDGAPGPVFFYAGNEADVELYVNHTGLMWESAPEAGALLVFAEHRYYGKSAPLADEAQLRHNMGYLTSEQALADYAALIFSLKQRLNATRAPVVAFGGSYGGMLAAWLRIHYPSAVDGAIAASAPIWAFEGEEPPPDAGGFAAVVTRDASPAAGAAPACVDNLRAAWRELFARARSDAGRSELSGIFRLCGDSALSSEDDALSLAYWLQSAFDYLSMGNFPYESDYLTNGDGLLPRYPMQAACAPLADAALPGDPAALLSGLRDAAAVFYNVSGAKQCFKLQNVNDATARDDDFWGYQACTEMVMPMSRDGVRDAFWPQPWDAAAFAADCQATWNVTPRPLWATVSYGGRRLRSATNIVFSNGGLDPWRATGVTFPLSRSVLVVDIPEGAHHLDLMFSSPHDPQSVRDARALERREIARWVREAYRADPPRGGPPDGGSESDGTAWSPRATQLFLAAAVGACISAGVAAFALLCTCGVERPILRVRRMSRGGAHASDGSSPTALPISTGGGGGARGEAWGDAHEPLLHGHAEADEL